MEDMSKPGQIFTKLNQKHNITDIEFTCLENCLIVINKNI